MFFSAAKGLVPPTLVGRKRMYTQQCEHSHAWRNAVRETAYKANFFDKRWSVLQDEKKFTGKTGLHSEKTQKRSYPWSAATHRKKKLIELVTVQSRELFMGGGCSNEKMEYTVKFELFLHPDLGFMIYHYWRATGL